MRFAKCVGNPIVEKMGVFPPKINNNFDPNSPNELRIGSNLEEHEWKKKCWEQNFDSSYNFDFLAKICQKMALLGFFRFPGPKN